MTDDEWMLHITQYALGLSSYLFIQAVVHRFHDTPANLSERSGFFQELRSQVKAARQSFAVQAPTHLLQRCVAAFDVIEDVLRLTETAHPDANPNDIVEELQALTVLLRATQPPPDGRTA
ncbi:MAG: hypothetical protein LBI48_13120 [Burkholderiaceae bacterium]|jgi:hypothetical protein|nr:hypothetical protein [Burkholderiaceae bacterium]